MSLNIYDIQGGFVEIKMQNCYLIRPFTPLKIINN